MGGVMAWSKYQARIYSVAPRTRDHVTIKSVAGSGKSTTLVELSKRLPPQRKIFCAFNKHIVNELSRRFDGLANVTTLHALGYRRICESESRVGWRIDENKYHAVVSSWLEKHKDQWCTDFKWLEIYFTIRDLIEYRRLSLCGDRKMASHIYGIDTNPVAWHAMKECIRVGNRMVWDQRILDYTDMLWVPWEFELKGRAFLSILVDEIQDLSNAARALVIDSCDKQNGRIIGCGDPSQSIMAFAMADAHSYDNTRDTLDAKELPLSICYRCPTSHIELAKALVPEIEARENAPDGAIDYDVPLDSLNQDVRANDLVICRMNAPVIKFALDLIRQGRFARVRGRQVGTDLTAFLRNVEKEYGWNVPDVAIRRYHEDIWTKLKNRKAPRVVKQQAKDRFESALACVEGISNHPFSTFLENIKKLFSDDNARGAINCSSVHRAKGLEADRVAILEPQLLGAENARVDSDDARRQEDNIRYVALTRAKQQLWFGEPTNGK